MKDDRGFVLITVLLLLLVLAVTAVALNSRAGLQSRMGTNHTQAIQSNLGQQSAIQWAVWNLNQNPAWRKTSTPYKYPRDPDPGLSYTVKVEDSLLTGYTDVITVSVRAPGMPPGKKGLPASFRYYINGVAIAGLNEPHKIDIYHSPSGVSYLYIADTGNHRILQLNLATNQLTTVAGTGMPSEPRGYSASEDGGRATSARLNRPTGISVDKDSGDIYVADTDNCIIRKINMAIPEPTIKRIAGTGDCKVNSGSPLKASFNYPQGVFFNKDTGIVWVADTLNNQIRRFDERTTAHVDTVVNTSDSSGYSGDGGPAESALLNRPTGVQVDRAGNIFIADSGNNCIRKVSIPQHPNNVWRISTVVPGLNQPREVVVDDFGNLFITDSGNNAVRLMSGTLRTLAGTPPSSGSGGDNGPAVQATLFSPGGIALGGSRAGGKIYVADTGNNRIRVLSLKKVKELY